MPTKKSKLTVVMDPGATTGIAVFSNKSLVKLDSFLWQRDLVKLMHYIQHYAELGAHFVVETPKRGAPGPKRNGVAMVRQKAQTLTSMVIGFGAEVDNMCPKYKVTKLGKEEFAKYFPKWDGKTNQHNRDAALLGYVYLREPKGEA